MWTYVADSQRLKDSTWGLGREYLLTNGLGGYASSSVLGCNTRRYHGLLVAALKPPLDRWVLLSHFDELLVGPAGRQPLSTTEYPGGFYPDGFTRLTEFALDPLPLWRWRVGDLEITKRLVLVHGRDLVLVHYSAVGDTTGAQLVLSPLAAMRSFHELSGRRDRVHAEPSSHGNGFHVFRSDRPEAELFVHAAEARASTEPLWYNNVLYRAETERGQENLEDLLRVGTFTFDLQRTPTVTVVAATGAASDAAPCFETAVRDELDRRQLLLRLAEPRDQREQALVVAADQFLVRRPFDFAQDKPHGKEELVSILAGYPWFADWGRDTMIALPGLCLATGRTELARGVLRLWAGLVSDGMLPNRFEDDNRHLSYNAVDSALWFLQAASAMLQATGDEAFLREVLWPAATEILDRYHDGTRYNIHADSDGLLVAGQPHTQLTWMDAKLGDSVFTPRHGKAVEINALWLSGLELAADWAQRFGLKPPRALADRAKGRQAFARTFWYAEGGYLYDCVNERGSDPAIRPNQLLAVSLPHAPIRGEMGRSVVDVCRRHLLTPYGLRTLAPSHPSYRGRYVGGWHERDGAYHQGTVWAWLLGPYIDALMLSADVPSAARHEAQKVIDTVLAALDKGAIGTINEIFDGDAPHAARGCIAQAWSVAEILRVKKAHGL